MRFSEKWLREFVNPQLSSEQLAQALTLSGLEVEDVQPVSSLPQGVVVGQLLQFTPHPQADRLHICSVDVGEAEPLQIVCGARELRAGAKVVCARVGASLPTADGGILNIRAAKLRGVRSAGMLCSSSELQLEGESDGLLYLPDITCIGQDIVETLQLNERLLEIKLTPNRGDCLSVYGIARDLSAFTSTTLNLPAITAVANQLTEKHPVAMVAPQVCGRYVGRVIRGVNARAQTPDLIKRRLQQAGMQSINILVDISNYVMLELGQPSHVFDLDALQGPLEVRWARSGEQLTLLSGTPIELDEQTVVIADRKGVQGLAGVMGGQASAVSEATSSVYLEMAFWQPAVIRGCCRRYRLNLTEAAQRFERGVDYAKIPAYLEYMTALILEHCQGQAGPLDDHLLDLPKRGTIVFRPERANQVLGINLAADQMATILERLGMPSRLENEALHVTVPSHRFDIELEVDLIEEVARIYGFDRLPARRPVAAQVPVVQKESVRSLHTLRHILAGLGYQETLGLSMTDPALEADFGFGVQPIALANPLSQKHAVLRTTLIGSLVQALVNNVRHNCSRVRLFEWAAVFHESEVGFAHAEYQVAGIKQTHLLAGLAYGSAKPEQWAESARWVDFFDVKGDLQALLPKAARFVAKPHPAFHPGRSAWIELDDQTLGWMGELHPQWLAKYELPRPAVVFELCCQPLLQLPPLQVSAVPKTPRVERDLALVLDRTITAAAVLSVLNQVRAKSAGALIENIALFDCFEPEANMAGGLELHERSLAFRVTLRDPVGVLNETQIQDIVDQLLARAQVELGARLR